MSLIICLYSNLTNDNRLYIQEKYLGIDSKLILNVIRSKRNEIVKLSMKLFEMNYSTKALHTIPKDWRLNSCSKRKPLRNKQENVHLLFSNSTIIGLKYSLIVYSNNNMEFIVKESCSLALF